jgi:hypothetical protein
LVLTHNAKHATLNTMFNSLMSVHKALEGTFLFDATPMAPLGMEVLVIRIPANVKHGVIMPPKHGNSPMLPPTTLAFVSSRKNQGVNTSQTHSAINIMQSLFWS